MGARRDSYDNPAEDEGPFDELVTNPLDRALLEMVEAAAVGIGAVADIGCGPGRTVSHFGDRSTTTVDRDLPPTIGVARDGHPVIDFRAEDTSRLPFSDQAWGGVVALYAINRVDPSELAGVFAEFYRVLRPGGTVLISFHIDDEVRQAEQSSSRAVNLDLHFHERAFVEAILRQAGLSLRAYVERPPYRTEVATTRGYLLAQRNGDGSAATDPSDGAATLRLSVARPGSSAGWPWPWGVTGWPPSWSGDTAQ
jgi:SAM-dependent methyltransferase